MKYFSMFSGIGGFELGIEKATKGEWKCVGFSEIDKYAIQTYKKHFPKHKNYGDATEIRWEDLPDFELLIGGFPCQAFSVAGRRKGFDDTRGTLFFEIARIIKGKKPKYLLLENVKGLLNHCNGETFRTILRTLDELGYDAEWQILNSKYFTGQNRERVFIFGYLRTESPKRIFPIKENKNVFIKTLSRKGKKTINCLTARSPMRAIADSTIVFSLQPKTGNPKKGGTGVLFKEDGTTYCIDTGNSQALMDCENLRYFMPIEYERLQSFPNNWTEGVSNQQRYKQMGNAVTVNVIEAIIERMKERIK